MAVNRPNVMGLFSSEEDLTSLVAALESGFTCVSFDNRGIGASGGRSHSSGRSGTMPRQS